VKSEEVTAEEWDRVLASVVCVHGDAEHCSPCCIDVIRRAQADAIEWARQLYQNWSTRDHGNLIESYNRLLSEKVDQIKGQEIKAPGPKFKKGQTVRIIVETEHENYIGAITGSEAIEGGEWRYGVQLPTMFLPYCTEEELEAVEEGKE